MNATSTLHTDVLLIGAGPIGIEMAVELKKQGIVYEHVEAGVLGQTISWYAPGTQFFSSPDRIEIAGHTLITPNQQKATAEQYLDYLRSVVADEKLSIHTFHRVVSIEKKGDKGFTISLIVDRSTQTADFLSRAPSPVEVSKFIHCKKIILAIGDMHAPKTLGIQGESLSHVNHYMEAPHRYYGQRVCIVGGKNSAVEAAIRLQRAGAHVTISYRGTGFDEKRVKYWLLPELLHLISKEKIRFLPETRPIRISAQSIILEAKNGELEVPCDDVLLLTGYRQSKELFQMAGINLKGEREQVEHDNLTMETSVTGIFVAGTAAAGTQVGGVRYFIENCHHHVERISAALRGLPAPELSQASNEGFLEN